MSCLTIDKQFLTKCRDSQPGVTEIYLANYNDVYQTGYTLNATSDGVSSMTFAIATGFTSGCFFKFVMNREVAGLTDECIINIQNGSAIYKPKLEFKISSLSADVRTLFKELAQATVVAIVKTVSGQYFLAGRYNGLDAVSTTSLQTGVASSDFAGLTVTLEGLEKEPIIEVSSTIISSLLVTV